MFLKFQDTEHGRGEKGDPEEKKKGGVVKHIERVGERKVKRE